MIKLLLRFSLAFFLCFCCFAADLMSAQLPLKARNIEGPSEEEEVISSNYVLPNQIFNNGKPYYASKDPVSGQLDFNIKKPAGFDSAINEVIDPNEKAIITSSSPNIHDFLNLPVKYSSSKFVYPLVSSSYANLKYQGSNKYYITNKKPTQVIQASSMPNYHASNYYTLPTTKLKSVTAASSFFNNNSISTTSVTFNTTTKKPTNKLTTTSSSLPTTTISTSTSAKTITTTTTTKIPIAQTSVTVQSTNISPKHTTPIRKPTQTITTTMPQTSTMRRKFEPIKKYSLAPPLTTEISLLFPDQEPLNTTVAAKPMTTPTLSNDKNTDPSDRNTAQPVKFTEDLTGALPFNPFQNSLSIPDLDPADIYHSLDQKNSENKFEQKTTMTFDDIFNTLIEEVSAVAANNPINHGLDAQGNLMGPIDPSKPSPFEVHNSEPLRKLRPNIISTIVPQNSPPPQMQEQPLQPSQTHQQLSAVSGSQENFSNEYVSYQVQKPNILQYRPAPGAINNVVISPGQSSASLVLGSQQQVGQNGFGTVKKEPLFSKEHSVQYGTVINENISDLKRQYSSTPSSYEEMPKKSTVSNFHQNGNFVSNQESKIQDPQRHLSHIHNYQELTPARPPPYQQLHLVDIIRTKLNNPIHQKPSLLPPSPQNQPEVPPKPIESIKSVNLKENGNGSMSLGSNHDTKELFISTNIRFPSNEEQFAEIPAANGPPADNQVNGHAQPLSLQQIKHSNPIAFPKQEDYKSQQNEIIYQNTPNVTANVQTQKQELLTMSQHQQKLTFPPANEPNTPAQHMIPPPLPNSFGSEQELQKTSHLHVDTQYAYNDFTRNPTPGITRSNHDRYLPNILPQFRPNAKISSGHLHQTNFNQEPGNIRVAGLQQPIRGAISSNPQFSHRRQHLGGPPKRYPLNMLTDYPAGHLSRNGMPSRRMYTVPLYPGGSLDRPGLHAGRPMAHNIKPAESINVEGNSLTPKLEKLPAFEEEDLVIMDRPQTVAPTKDSLLFSEAKLEPVVTLQMLQSQKKPVSLQNPDGEIQVPTIDNKESENSAQDNLNNLYVVYPINGDTNAENLESAENESSLPGVANIGLPTGSEYQNTPFSIIRDQQQEPVLKNKKALSVQQYNKAQQNKDSFPYPIEKPDPLFNELNSVTTTPGIVITPKIRNGAYVPATETPIAIAYTPTEPSRHHSLDNYKQVQQKQIMYSNNNLVTPIIKEIRPDVQTEEELNAHDFDLRAQNFEKDFMAPFYPSVSLDTVTPTNGWNILSKSTKKNTYEKIKIDRSDVENEQNKVKQHIESLTKSFELDIFQPELQGGFKPIYPPDYKHDNEQKEQKYLQQHEIKNMPLALTTSMDYPHKLDLLFQKNKTSSSIYPTNSTTTAIPLTDTTQSEEAFKASYIKKNSATTEPTETTKSKFETSLAALLFGENDDGDEPIDQNHARQEPNKAMMSGPRSMPRMGPRSLKI